MAKTFHGYRGLSIDDHIVLRLFIDIIDPNHGFMKSSPDCCLFKRCKLPHFSEKYSFLLVISSRKTSQKMVPEKG